MNPTHSHVWKNNLQTQQNMPLGTSFARGRYGWDPRLMQSALNNLRRQASTTEQGFINRAGATTPTNLAARLNRFREGAQLGGQVYQQGALPLAMGEQEFAEGQRARDIGFGLQSSAQQQAWQQFLMQLEENKRQFNKSQKTFEFGTPWGGISF